MSKSMEQREKNKIEFGDFQTPRELALLICQFLKSTDVAPLSIVEPTCGKGSFLIAALETFTSAKQVLGVDINSSYLDGLRDKLCNNPFSDKVKIKQGDFFTFNWGNIVDTLPEPLLIIGNPPWVTNSELGSINGGNLPKKSNFQNHIGFDAITGKSNFDISEWMLMHLIKWTKHKQAIVAMLCKTAVARKVLKHVWQNNLEVANASIYLIDAKKYFNASADACLLVFYTNRRQVSNRAYVYPDFTQSLRISAIGISHSQLIADIEKYHKWKQLEGEEYCKWRSGIKHDCTKIMELIREGNLYKNGLGECYELEDNYLYPLLKSSDVAREKRIDSCIIPRRWVIITQKFIGQDTSNIRDKAPQIWNYLLDHRKFLDQRKSSIYKNQHPFAIFAIGDYTFSPWKVAISGLYKKLHFTVIGPYTGKPRMLDDTCYFIPCQDEDEANLMADLLNSSPSREFFSSFIFWDAKRPITVEILKRIDLVKLADVLGKRKEIEFCLNKKNPYTYNNKQMTLF